MLELSFWNPERLDREIARLTELLEDLRVIRREGQPSPDVLDDSPMIDGWKLTTRSVPCLAGVYINHPKIDNGLIGITSELLFIDSDCGFARTRSRFYTLGQRAPKEDGDARI